MAITCDEGCTCDRHKTQRCAPGCACGRHRAQAHRKVDPEEARQRKNAKGREYMRARRAADPETARLKAREQYRKNGRKHNLKYQFRITPEQYAQMIISQEGCCYLCEEQMTGVIHIDHDRSCCPDKRSCGQCVRGLACQLCNQGIGQFRDDPVRLRRVADNLEKAMLRLRA